MEKYFIVILSVFYFFPFIKFISLNLVRPIYVLLNKNQNHQRIKNDKTLSLGSKIKLLFSQFEYIIYPIRKYFIGVPLSLWVLSKPILFQLNYVNHVIDINYLIFLGFTVLNFWTIHKKAEQDFLFLEFLRLNPEIHPENFFNRYKKTLTFGSFDIFSCPVNNTIQPHHSDFRQDHRPKLTSQPIFKGIFDTAYLAHLPLSALQKTSSQYLFENSDNIACMWGKRMLQLSQSKLSVKNEELLEGKKGKFIFIFNHKSSLDFALAFYAFSNIKINQRAPRLRYIVAKDHFKDNPLIYSVFGIGKVIEVIGMIFIERKKRQKSFENLKSAAQDLVDKNIDLAIYPQGTRAIGNFDRAGKRRDAGYYTTVSKKSLDKELAHLKKGTAYLILDTLQILFDNQSDENLNLVFVGIDGAATTLPKKSLKIQTENTINFTIGDVIELSPQIIRDVFPVEATDEEITQNRSNFIRNMNILIDEKMKESLLLHENLAKKYLTDLQGHFRLDKEKIKYIAQNINNAGESTNTIFQIIDRIYSLPQKEWNGYLSQLSQLLQNRIDQERLDHLLQEVSILLTKTA